MKLEVRLFATLRELLPKESRGVTTLELPEGGTVEEVIRLLKIPAETSLIVMVNGRRQLEPELLKEGDRVSIFPPVGGG